MCNRNKETSTLASEELARRIERFVGLLLILLLLPCGPVLAQEEDGEAIPYEQLKAQANFGSKAVEALEAVAKGSGSLENGKFNILISVRFKATQQQLNTWKEQFQDASELLYDATDGQLQFGEILICNNSRGGKNADIWIHPPSGRSHVPGGCVPGLGKEGCHINLYAEDITDSNANADGAWTIAHEWGHYALGMFDEYVTDPPKSGAICQIPRTYQAPDPPPNSDGSLMENYWNRPITEFCVSSNHDLDNPTTAGDEGGDTWQEDVHGESTWETLVDNFPSVNLPNGLPDQAMPAGHMDITWKVLEPETRLSLIIDESGSMSGSNIQNARSGAKLFVDLTKEGDKLGVGSFDSNARTVFSMREVDATARANAKSAIDGISAGGSTNIGGGLREGLSQIVNAGDPACQQTIILLSDGQHNTGENPLNVIPDLNKNNITVNAIALGAAGNTPLLRDVAQQTGGKLFFANSPSDLASIFAKLRTQTTENGGIITAAQSPVDPGQVVTQGVDVESGIQEATFLINWSGSQDVNLTLESPSGATITPGSASDPDIEHTAESNSEFYTVQNPEAGEWIMQIEGASANASSVDVSAQASGVNPDITFRASPNKVDVDFPDPVRIEANAQAPVTVTGATVTGTVTRPDGSMVSVDLVDDGTGGDVLADDGIYTASFDRYNQDGAYNFEITATTGSLKRAGGSGKAASSTARLFRGEALFTEEAVNGNIDAVPPSGPSDTPAPVFTRSETFSANVSNVPASIGNPPSASDDQYLTQQGQTLKVTDPDEGVLANDSDPDGDPLTASRVSGPSNGSLSLNDDGTFTYTPDPGFFGTDQFTYEARDGNGNSDRATVTIVVNAPPEASDDHYRIRVQRDAPVFEVEAPGVLRNDSDPDGDDLSASLVSGTKGLTFHSDGSFEYRFHHLLRLIPSDPSISRTFTYQASDGRGGTDQATVTLTIRRPQAPIASLTAKAEGSSVQLQWRGPKAHGGADLEVRHKGPGEKSYAPAEVQANSRSQTDEAKGQDGSQVYEATVSGLKPGTHQFEVRLVGPKGEVLTSKKAEATVRMEEALWLTAPAPNPVRREAILSFAVKEKSEARILLYNLLGQEVRTLYEGTPAAGESQTVRLDASGLPSGTYFLRLQAGGQTRTQQVTVLR